MKARNISNNMYWYYKNPQLNGSFVYGCLLDATKAFDRVNYGKLFSLLCDKNLPGVVIRFLLDSYSRRNVFTRWNNVLSNAIHMENGVKQGGFLSSILFCVYFDELLKRLESSGMGCYIGHHFYGCVGYVDDVKILCPSINGLQSMINVCENFADEFDATFNTKKTLYICYGSDNNATLRQVSWSGVKILGNRQWNTLVMSLCTTCTTKLTFIRKGVGGFIAAVNKMNSVFASVHAEPKLSLLQTYCASWYGCQALQLGTPYCDLMDVEWRKAVRKTAGLPR